MRFLHFLYGTLLQLLSDMRAQKLRCVLSMAGITWGVYAFVMLLAIGKGIYQSNQHNITAISKPTLNISLHKTSDASGGFAPRRRPWFAFADQQALKQVFPQIKSVSSVLSNDSVEVSYQDKLAYAPVLGKMPSAFEAESSVLENGRFFSALDNQRYHRVAVLTHYQKLHFFGDNAAVGKTIFLNGIPFRVIGTLGNAAFSTDYSDIIIPYNTAADIWQNQKPWAIIELKPNQTINQFIPKIKAYLSERYHLDADDKHVFDVFSMTQFRSDFMALLWGMQIFLGFCGIMMLIVGGIGVSNMMYLSVKERTAEIGLKMAIGAKAKHVLTQFLLETALFTLLGGVVALIAAAITLKLLNLASLPSALGHPSMSGAPLLFAWVLLALLALLAGLSPAKAAANTPPIVALRAK